VTTRALRRLGAVSLVAVALTACGKKGNPLPPLNVRPAAVGDFSASLSGGRITLQFTVPAANPDDPSVAAPERIEIYRVVTAPDATVPPASEIVGAPGALRGQVAVRRPEDAPPSSTSPPLPLPGEPASFVETVDGQATGSWTYVAVGVMGRNRRGPASNPITVPLAALPVAPTALAAENTESTLTLSWQGTGNAYRVFSAAQPLDLTTVRLLTPTPVAEPRFTQPVEFGRERCFVVRTVQETRGATVEGPPSDVFCTTAVDRYPPPAPTNLRAIQEGTAITLTWTPSGAPDLGGYIVLRGDKDGVNLQPLNREPVREPAFKDETARSGEMYVYSVYAVDTAPTPNVSQQSDRQLVTVR
jgi:predicted small lipoprotein YifL